MDAVQALARWYSLCQNTMGIEPSGYVFRSRSHFDEISIKPDAPMVCTMLFVIEEAVCN